MYQDQKRLSNPKLAETYIATLFIKLYESWPQCLNPTAEEVTGIQYDIDNAFWKDAGSTTPIEWEIFCDLMAWLCQKDYIQMDKCLGSNTYQFNNVRLTKESKKIVENTFSLKRCDLQPIGCHEKSQLHVLEKEKPILYQTLISG
ncbi:hypothetical protein [Algicola sagamiensis]|uniref:hypothetical protein n=1 Tax=Algicola sagamiensis TaxID=163869 RepID=UPI00037987A4|nr:hypothetical protein [Algicola sagamiensis]